jgi:heptosyltransferase-2
MKEPRLLIRLGSMGDVVLATGAANAGRAVWGDGCLDVLVKEEWASLWENHPAVHEIHVWSKEDRNLSGLRRWSRRLREKQYLEVVDLQASLRTRLLAGLAGWSKVRRPRRHNIRRRLLLATRRWGPPGDFRTLDTYVEAAVPGAAAVPSLHPREAVRSRAREVVPEAGVAGLIPGARHVTKRWPLERFVEVGRGRAERSPGPVPVFFGPDEDALLNAWRALWPGDGTWIAVREPLAVVVACLERLSAVVTNDTGLMHVAAAVGTPVVSMFGPTTRQFGFFPAGEGHRVLEVDNLSCRPCTLHGGPHCPKGHFRCMLGIDPAQVAAALATVPGEEPLRTQAP